MNTKIRGLTAMIGLSLSCMLLSLTQQAVGQDGTWATKPPISSARFMWVAGEINGVIYAPGGWVVCTPYSTLDAYDPISDTWSQKAPMPTARGYHAGAVLNGQLYTLGGSVNCGVNVATVEAYDPILNHWVTKASMPATRIGHAVGVVNGIIYAAGGTVNGSGSIPSNVVDAYDPIANSWTPRSATPIARFGAAGAAVNGIFYVIGGNDGIGYVGTLEAYNPLTDTWTTKAPMPTARGSHAAAVLNGLIYVVGGASNAGEVATVEAYNPVTDTWSTVTPMPTVREAFAAATLNGVLYVIGGWNNTDGYLSSVIAFTPNQEFNQPPNCTYARATTDVLWPPNHQLVSVGITGVSDPDNDPVTILITSVTQDEPTNGRGDGDACPDAFIPDGTVLLRAERSEKGNGRVYRIAFIAVDGQGGSCSGAVNVCVPKNLRPGTNCVDDGQLYDSTACP